MKCKCGAELKGIGFIVSGTKTYHGLEVMECDDCDSLALVIPQIDKVLHWYTYDE